MQKITTFLTFNDQAEQAAKFYTSVFRGSKIKATTYYGEGAPMPKGTVMTVEIELAGQTFLLLNGGSSFKFSMGISLMVGCETQAEIDELWETLSAGGEKNVCGWLTDRFGVSWQIVPASLPKLLADQSKTDKVMAEVMKMTKLDISKLQAAAK